MTRKYQKQPACDVRRFEAEGHLLPSYMSLSEYYVVMALCRRGPATGAQIEREISRWLDNPLCPGGLTHTLNVVVGLGWARCTNGIYAILSKGIDIMRGCHVAFARMFGGDPAFRHADLLKGVINEFERS